ncbi:hypothetical protein PBI_TOURACH_91 [Mycobacterium phage Tourach]|uniref:Uncharacterized protein n=1 Tax=Mycobacterium phage Tourach TaxID=2599882 RepID=A0A5J6TWT2_9CAUD|nr:hypothetical protein J4T98_gp091 [Mycobacterium phage Tourach]QFG14327.1 hypothetical protein PBI_TOURACH_91 [Mycobacterium phage Tourach]
MEYGMSAADAAYRDAAKAPTLTLNGRKGGHAVQPHEVAFQPQVGANPFANPNADVPSRVKAIKAARDSVAAYGERLGLKDAKYAVEATFQSVADQGFVIKRSTAGDEIELTDAEKKAARKAIGQIHANMDVKLQAVLDAINHVRSNDPVGTLRKNSKGVYAFAFEPGKWLLIDVDKPAYKSVETPADSAAIQNSWELVVSG